MTKRTYRDGAMVELLRPLGRMSSVVSGGRTTSYVYDVASNVTTTTLPSANGYVETRTYDRAGRLNQVRNVKGATTLADITYTRDKVGNPLTETRTGASPVSKTFSYDNMDRLIGVCYLATTCPGATDPYIRWTYDGVGNRLTEARPSTATKSYTYDNMDRMLTAGTTSYTWDRNGNQLSAGTRTFTWDLANRMKTTVSGTTTTYSYDGDGVRLQASTGTQASAKTNFQWDINQPLPMLAREANGNNALLRRYVHGQRLIFMSTTSTNAWYYHYDPLGSVRNVTSGSGATQLTYDYEPYGTIRSSSGSSPTNLLKFTGEYNDPTGLYHLRARQYDPASARFTRLDPVGQLVAESAASRYAYASNRPTVLIDPSGAVVRPSQEFSVAVDTPTSVEYDLGAPAARGKRYGNGCGPSGWKSQAIPDRLPGGFDFRYACERHDICYGNWGEIRFPCDTTFRSNFRSECSDISWNPIQTIQTPYCFSLSEIYYRFVRQWGRGPFTDAQLDDCPYGKLEVRRVQESCLKSIRRRDD